MASLANRVPVIAINCSTQETIHFKNIQSASKTLNINHRKIKFICEGKRGYKSAVSPFTNIEYDFNYEDLNLDQY